VISAGPADTFAALKPVVAFEVLGLIASVLDSARSGHSFRSRSGQRDDSRSGLTVMDLPWFVGMLPRADRQWLYHAAQQWSPALGRAVERALNFEAARRERANHIPDQIRRDAAWARDVAPGLRAAGIRRIAARAYRRARDRRAERKQTHRCARPAGSCHQ
jgi:hypothetical protein